MAEERFLVFRARGRICAIALSSATETMRPLPIDAVPNAPQGVVGAAVVRGTPMPVVDVAALIDPKAKREGNDREARFVIVRAGERRVALLVDGVIGPRNLAREEFHALPPLLREALPDAVTALTAADADVMLVLEGARLLAAAGVA